MASCAICITRHAIERFRERVEDLPDRDICEQLASPAVERAALIGAPYIRLEHGQRIVLQGFTVVTVLPRGCSGATLLKRRPH
ncbi:hypothetical protein [Qipengyuania sp.]|uniref:hypothetical protein n=1 Tax=Qipengyuania sp. TaxID=2004515 RepID=UPI003517AB21